METTLYNHKFLGTAEKPLIPNIVYKRTIESLEEGRTDFYLEVVEKYSLESFQKQYLKGLYTHLCKQKL